MANKFIDLLTPKTGKDKTLGYTDWMVWSMFFSASLRGTHILNGFIVIIADYQAESHLRNIIHIGPLGILSDERVETNTGQLQRNVSQEDLLP